MTIDIDEKILDTARSLGPLLREHASEAERTRRLARPVLEAMASADLFDLWTPRSLGGVETDLVTLARVIEEVATFDSTAAWAMMANANNLLLGRIAAEGAEEMHGARKRPNIVGAAFNPPLMAVEEGDGFRMNGPLRISSFSDDASWLLVSFLVLENGVPRGGAMPEMWVGYLSREDYEVHDTWYSLGMRGTSSNDLTVKDAFLPRRRASAISPEFEANRLCPGPVYKLPAMTFAGTLVGAALGVARLAIDELKALGQKKVPFGMMKPLGERPAAQAAVGRAEATLQGGRAWFYEVFGEVWQHGLSGQPFTMDQKVRVTLAVAHAVQSAAQAVELVFRAAGTTGVYERTTIGRCFRDAQTIRHQAFVAETRYDSVGQALFGLQPDFPFIGL